MKHVSGSLEVVCGSMFSGKTEELIRRLRRASIAREKVQVFKPAIDIRYAVEKVEPFAHDRLEDNLNPVGAVFYAASTAVCTPASLAQEVGLALGAQAGEARLKQVVMDGGFKRFRRAAETPFNLILEARLS